MARTTRKKTLADYVVIAISPVLIMTLVGSLAFFLLELTYHGNFELRIKWILFWFVLAAVLVARIAIEQGREYASLFGVALTAAVGLATARLVDQFLLGWLLLGITWWCTWKLTFDCTLIDDREDASGEGLLQAAGLEALSDANSSTDSTAEPVERRKVHAPGKWVVYFSLAALPLFGAGQLLTPTHDTAARAYGFRLLAVYVASALGLLLTTSFLGLRRYLRQRKLQMPAAMTRSWLAMGAGLALAILCLALLLPQPQGEYSVNALVDKVDSKLREASRFAVVPGDRAKGEGRRIGEQDPKADKPGSAQAKNTPDKPNQAQPGDGGSPGKNGSGKTQGNQKDEKSGGQGDSNEKGKAQGGNQSDDKGQGARRDQGQNRDAEDRQPAERQAAVRPPKETQNGVQRATPPPSAPPGSAIGSFLQFLAGAFKWLVYGAIAIAVVIFLTRHWSRFLEMLAKFWAELLAAFGGKHPGERSAADERSTAPAEAIRFAAFENPFFSGEAGRMPPAQLVRYTFEALEAWARERVVARPPEQTPLEFAQELGRREPALAKDVASTADLYVRVAYARKNPSRESVAVLERLWRRMGMGAGA